MFLQLFSLVAVVASGLAAVSIFDCPQNLPQYNLHAHGQSCYNFFVTLKRDFDTAKRVCHELGSHLVVIRDLETQDFLYRTMKDLYGFNGVVWIGLSDAKQEGVYKWIDDSPAGFTYWADGQPGFWGHFLEDCVGMDMGDGGQWNDYSCSDNFFMNHREAIVCEHPIMKTTHRTTTAEPTTLEPSTSEPTTPEPMTSEPTTSEPTTSEPTTPEPTSSQSTKP